MGYSVCFNAVYQDLNSSAISGWLVAERWTSNLYTRGAYIPFLRSPCASMATYHGPLHPARRCRLVLDGAEHIRLVVHRLLSSPPIPLPIRFSCRPSCICKVRTKYRLFR